MARRKSRRKAPARRRSATVNILGIAEGALIANAITQGVFNADLKTFFMSTDGGGKITTANARAQITLRELISGATGGSYGTSGTSTLAKVGGGSTSITYGQSFSDQIKENLNENGLRMVGSLIAIPIAFKVGGKLAKKPRALVNKVGKMSGLPMRV
jgi:hypothetical protein